MAKEIIQLNTQEAVDEAGKIVEGIVESSRLVVNSQPTFEKAKGQLTTIKEIRKGVTEKKDSIVKPLNEALKNARSLFKPIEEKMDLIENYLKGQILKYNQALLAEQARREEEARKKIEEAEKSGEKEIDVEKLAKPVERVAEKVEAIKTRKVKRLKINDQEKIPRAYLVPDEALIKQALLNGEKVAGCEIIEEEIAINSY